jgi:3-phenylpropionate/trans-cinnamate dioxygenase ferredoxin subunit
VDAVCSHAHYYLDEGEVDVEERTIECPKHGSTFDLETGKPTSLPALVPVEAFAVKVDDDEVMIEV